MFRLGAALLALSVVAVLTCSMAAAGSLELRLTGIPRVGTLYVMITRDPHAFGRTVCEENLVPEYFTWCVMRRVRGDGADEVVSIDLSNATHAIKAYIDENENRRLDIGVLGAVEPTAFGNDARAFFGQPSFRHAAIEINGVTFHEIALKE